jgi:NADH-quinone oxidoreductase subunit N
MFPNTNRIATLQAALGNDLLLFVPELLLCAAIIGLLLARLIPLFDRTHLGVVGITFLVSALSLAIAQFARIEPPGAYFDGMLVLDAFAYMLRCLVLLAALLTVLLTQLTGIPDALDSADFHVLLLGGTLGMLLMGSANHLLMVFIAVEMASLPSYALAGFLKGRRTGSEAALKYVVYGAGASGVMLYGITLIAGTFGTAYLPDVCEAVSRRPLDLPVLAGFSLLLIGLGFKLAAFPFHFWCPDVFEGAAAEVAGFLSVASKAAAIGLTTRILLTLQTHQLHAHQMGDWRIPGSLGLGVGVVAALTVTFGNLTAFGQTNMKRLLAYSTIAHAGTMLLAVATVTPQAASAVLYYLLAYIIMNLGAFAVVAFVRNATRSEELEAYRGLVRRSPILAVTMTIFLLALLGLPPLAGFAGKFQVFEALYSTGKAAGASAHPNLATAYYILLGIGAVNTAMSAYYYLKIVRVMLLDDLDESAGTTPAPILVGAASTLYLTVLAAALFAAGLVWNPIIAFTDRAAATFSVQR